MLRRFFHGSLAALMALILVLGAGQSAWAQSGEAAREEPAASAAITVKLNNETIELDPAPLLRMDRVFVPLRGLLERLGVTVDYDPDTGQVALSRGSLTVQLSLVDGAVTRNGEAISIDAQPFVEDGRAYVPLRFVVEVFGERVEWIPATRTVAVWSVYRPGQQPEPAKHYPVDLDFPAVVDFTAEEFELLVRVINAEAFGEPFEGQVAVGAVIINRVLHPRDFPSSIKEVILQPNQFRVVENGQIGRDVAESAYRAALAALAGEDPTGGALFFYNPEKTTSEFLLSRPVLVRIMNHVFAR